MIAAFGHFPALSQARDAAEREHWLRASKELLDAFIRTLPPASSVENEEWEYDSWKPDEKIFEIVAARVFECSRSECAQFWQPMLDLPPAAHHHITQFLSYILLQAISTTPSRVSELIPIWREMAEYLFESKKWETGNAHDCQDVWGYVFLYGSHFGSADDEDFIPLVKALHPIFERHVKSIAHDPYSQSSFARFLTTKSGEQLLVGAFAWLHPSWSTGTEYFWGTIVDQAGFPKLLEHAWRNHFPAIRKNAEALKAFKTLTLKLAAHQVPVALEVQSRIGNTSG